MFNLLAISLGLLAVVLVVYIQLSLKVFHMTYANTRDTSLAMLASLRVNEQENVVLIRDIETELAEVNLTAEQAIEYREMIGRVEGWLLETRVAMLDRLHWRRHHLRYAFTRGVRVYVTEVIKNRVR